MIKDIKELKESLSDKTKRMRPDANSDTPRVIELIQEINALKNQVQQLEQRVAVLEQQQEQQQAQPNSNWAARVTRLEEMLLMMETWESRLATLEGNPSTQAPWYRRISFSTTKKIRQTPWPKFSDYLKFCFLLLWRGIMFCFDLIRAFCIFVYHKLGLKKTVIACMFLIALISILWGQPWKMLQPGQQQKTGRLVTFDDPTPKNHRTDFSSSSSIPTFHGSTPEEEAKYWVNMSQSPDTEKQLQAIPQLERLNTETAQRRLTQMLLPSKATEVRVAAAKALTVARQYAPACDALVNIISNQQNDLELKMQAVQTLGIIGTSKEALMILDMAKNTSLDENLRMYCVHSVDAIGSGRCAAELVPLLKDSNAYIREATAAALGNFNYPGAATDLLDCMKQETEGVAKVAMIRALGKIDMKANLIATDLLSYYPHTIPVYQEEISKALKQLSPHVSIELQEQIAQLSN